LTVREICAINGVQILTDLRYVSLYEYSMYTGWVVGSLYMQPVVDWVRKTSRTAFDLTMTRPAPIGDVVANQTWRHGEEKLPKAP